MKLKCPRCGSRECYYRFRTDDIACRKCGKITSMKVLKIIEQELKETQIKFDKQHIKEVEKNAIT